MSDSWRTRAIREIEGIKPIWSDRFGWQPQLAEASTYVDLLLTLVQRTTARRYLLRLRYEADYETAGRREAFVHPDDPDREASWPQSVPAFKSTNSPPAICLEGTWGFHSVLHRERDGRVANLNRLLLEIQRCLNPN